MVRIWGRWCGPQWTAGRKIYAREYDWENDPSPRVQDNLDACCRLHDRVYGATKDSKKLDKSDLELARCAERIALRTRNPLKQGAALAIATTMRANVASGGRIRRLG